MLLSWTIASLLLLPQESPAPAHPDFELWSAGAERLFADPVDAGLLRASRLLEARAAELRQEIGAQLPPGILEALVQVLAAPHDLRLRLHPERFGVHGALPVDIQLSAVGTADEVESWSARTMGLLALAGLPPGEVPAERPGFTATATPAGPLLVGRTSGSTGTVWHVGLGALDEAAPAPPSNGLPADVEPLLGIGYDTTRVFQWLASAAEKMQESAAAPFAKESHRASLAALLAKTGLLRAPLAVRAVWGRRGDTGLASVRAVNAVAFARALHMHAEGNLSAKDLAMIPADATWASLSRTRWGGILDLLDLVPKAESQPDPRDVVKAFLGIDLRADLFDTLGGTCGLYSSEATGGGGLLSMVGFVSVEDPERLGHTLDTLAQRLNGYATLFAQGRIALRSFVSGETRRTTLTFPSLPVPLELSFALEPTSGYLFFAPTPYALEAALRRAREGGASLVETEAFRSGVEGSLDGLYGLSFVDAENAVREGYGVVSLLLSGVANAVRARGDETREAGPMMPSYLELLESARPLVGVSRVDGDDVVSTLTGSGSVVASLTTLLGGNEVLPVALAVGALSGAAKDHH